MIQLNPLGPNSNVVVMSNGVSVLFSYKTPVAAHIPGRGYVQSAVFYSRTTSKHVNRWTNKNADAVPHEALLAIIEDGLTGAPILD